MHRLRLIVLAGLVSGTTQAALADPPPASSAAQQEAKQLNQLPPVTPTPGHIDRTGRKEEGRASFYGGHFADKTMADGHKMNPNADVAASKSLPLGSVAKVTNLDNGKSTTVRIEDRGPYVGGRIIDLTPKAADQIDITKQGVAPVIVKPITIPTSDGGVKLGAGAAQTDPREVADAVQTTEKLAAPSEAHR